MCQRDLLECSPGTEVLLGTVFCYSPSTSLGPVLTLSIYCVSHHLPCPTGLPWRAPLSSGSHHAVPSRQPQLGPSPSQMGLLHCHAQWEASASADVPPQCSPHFSQPTLHGQVQTSQTATLGRQFHTPRGLHQSRANHNRRVHGHAQGTHLAQVTRWGTVLLGPTGHHLHTATPSRLGDVSD